MYEESKSSAQRTVLIASKSLIWSSASVSSPLALRSWWALSRFALLLTFVIRCPCAPDAMPPGSIVLPSLRYAPASQGIRRSGAVDGRTTHAGQGRRVQRDVLVECWPHGNSHENCAPPTEAIGCGRGQKTLEIRMMICEALSKA